MRLSAARHLRRARVLRRPGLQNRPAATRPLCRAPKPRLRCTTRLLQRTRGPTRRRQDRPRRASCGTPLPRRARGAELRACLLRPRHRQRVRRTPIADVAVVKRFAPHHDACKSSKEASLNHAAALSRVCSASAATFSSCPFYPRFAPYLPSTYSMALSPNQPSMATRANAKEMRLC